MLLIICIGPPQSWRANEGHVSEAEVYHLFNLQWLLIPFLFSNSSLSITAVFIHFFTMELLMKTLLDLFLKTVSTDRAGQFVIKKYFENSKKTSY